MTAEIEHGQSKDEGSSTASLVAGSGMSCGTDRRLALRLCVHTEQEDDVRPNASRDVSTKGQVRSRDDGIATTAVQLHAHGGDAHRLGSDRCSK
jgi:hypothetical protein